MALLSTFVANYFNKKYVSCPVKLDRKLCSLLNSYCSNACVESCPTQAISPKTHLIDEMQCNGCGSCVSSCPNGAVRIVNFSDEALVAKIHEMQGNPVLYYSCENCQQEPDKRQSSLHPTVRVQCLARLHPGILLLPFTVGAAAVWLDISACETCTNNQDGLLLRVIERNIVLARKWLQALGKKGLMLVGDEKPPVLQIAGLNEVKNRRDALDRRDFFNLVVKGLQDGSRSLASDFSPKAVKENADSNSSREKPDKTLSAKRSILLKALSGLSPEETEDACPEEHPKLKIERGCLLCGICSSLCPTGALIQDKKHQQVIGTLEFKPAFCINCGVCTNKCPENLVSLQPGLSIDAFISQKNTRVIETDLKQCKRCKDFYPAEVGEQGYCDVCSAKSVV